MKRKLLFSTLLAIAIGFSSCQDRWEVFKLAIRQVYGIEFNFTRTDEYFGICNDDETIWLMKENREEERQ